MKQWGVSVKKKLRKNVYGVKKQPKAFVPAMKNERLLRYTRERAGRRILFYESEAACFSWTSATHIIIVMYAI